MVHQSLLHRLNHVLESNEVKTINESDQIVSVYLLSFSHLPDVSSLTQILNNTPINSLCSERSKYLKAAYLLVFRSF